MYSNIWNVCTYNFQQKHTKLSNFLSLRVNKLFNRYVYVKHTYLCKYVYNRIKETLRKY